MERARARKFGGKAHRPRGGAPNASAVRVPPMVKVLRNAWIKTRLKALNKTQTGLAEALGIPTSTMADITVGRRKIRTDELLTMARYLEWPTDRVLQLVLDPAAVFPAASRSKLSMQTVVVMGEVEAGIFRDRAEYDPTERFAVEVPVDPRYAAFFKAGLLVRGPAMNRRYPDGSIVIVVRLDDLGQSYELKPNRRVVVERSNDAHQVEVTIKELRFDTGGYAWLWPDSDHPDCQQPWKVPPDWHASRAAGARNGVRIAALVVGSYRSE